MSVRTHRRGVPWASARVGWPRSRSRSAVCLRGVLLGRLGQLPQSRHALQLGEDVGHRLVPANSTTDADSTVAQTTTDDDRVTATNAVGSSGDSNVASIGTA